jgi:hypothetical protein
MFKFALSLVALMSGMSAMADQLIWACNYNNNPNAITISSVGGPNAQYGIHISVTEPDLQQKLGAGFDAEGNADWLIKNNTNFTLTNGNEYGRIDVSFVNGGVKFQSNSCRVAGCTPNPDYGYWFKGGLCVKSGS